VPSVSQFLIKVSTTRRSSDMTDLS